MHIKKFLILAVLVAAAVGQLGLEIASARSGVVFAQVGEEEEVSQEEADQEGGGQSDAEAETDPGAGEEAAAEEEGPPWTYQMARMALGLIVLSALGLGWLYYRMIAARQRVRT
jgi:VIT1/CCC1 family predicted Fe2+/Mn2+ transporter